ACALAFAREGAGVALVGRRPAPLESAAEKIRAAGGRALAVPCDVTVRAEIERALQAAEQHFGRLTCILNNAGALVANAENTSDDEWTRILEANLTSAFLVSRAALPALRRAGGGSIINMSSSSSGLVSMKARVAY